MCPLKLIGASSLRKFTTTALPKKNLELVKQFFENKEVAIGSKTKITKFIPTIGLKITMIFFGKKHWGDYDDLGH